MTDESNALQTGSTFGKHRIVRLLGRGGMGEVYEVEHELTGERHALKLLSAEVMEVPGALERFQREAKVMARLKHSGIVRVDDSGDTEGHHWLRMELMPGREVQGKQVVTLEEYMEAKGGRLPESEVKKLTEEILEALVHAHGQGLVHRDLKPANVLLDGERLKIADFGLVNAAGADWMDTQVRSTVINQDEEDTLIDDGSGTGSRSRAIMGTYAFMSPEQKKGQPADARSDLYAVGLMVFRMLTGLDSPGMKRPSELGLGLSLDMGWDAWLIKTLEENPAARFPSAGEMKTALSFEEATIASAPEALIDEAFGQAAESLGLGSRGLDKTKPTSQPFPHDVPPLSSLAPKPQPSVVGSSPSPSGFPKWLKILLLVGAVVAIFFVFAIIMVIFNVEGTDESEIQDPSSGTGSITETIPWTSGPKSSVASGTHSLRLVSVGPIQRLIIIDEGGGSRNYEYVDIPEGWAQELQFTDSCRLWCSSVENLKFSVDGGADKMFGGSGSGSYALKPETNPSIASPKPPVVSGTHSLRLFAVAPIKHLIVGSEGGLFPETNKSLREFKDLPAGWGGTLTFRDSFKCYCTSLENLRFFVDDGPEKKIGAEGIGNFTWKPRQSDE
jgi:serine/threonine protein kinase